MNEWGFAGEIKSWWDALIAAQPRLRLGDVRIEEKPEGDPGRSDITVYDAAGTPLLVLELRLPDHAQPDPDDIANINNAMSKAGAYGARWSATSDGRVVRLLDHSRHDLPTRERAVPVAPLNTAVTRTDLDIPAKRKTIRAAWEELLLRLAPVLTGHEDAPRVPADVFFVESLRASLARPFVATRDAISLRNATDATFAAELIRWMVDEQAWQHNAADIEDEIAHVAQVATYVFATRLLFYGALRRAQPGLPALELPSDGNSAISRAMIAALFDEARTITGDFETVFVYDDVTKWALISEMSCRGWAEVVALLDHFQLETIGYDVLGRLFEWLIDPHERYEWGQHYTEPDVVDLMLSAALPDGKGTVADFASGGGTFLVRAYTRKKAFEPQKNHNQRLAEIAGGDISAFAASVSTISLASQHLGPGTNYPQVRVGSFFTVKPGAAFVSLPGDDRTPTPRVLPQLDAVVCNPPYVGYPKIGAVRRNEAVAAYAADWPMRPKLGGRWNYHLPFWFHAAKFLRPGGRLTFITSGEWLDSDYGEQLQDWLTSNFHVELVVESMAEQWFGEARVGTVVLVARLREPNEATDSSAVRFVSLRKPLVELYGASTADDTERLLSVDQFRDRLLALTGHGEGDDFDHHVIAQAELRTLGMSGDRYVGSTWRSRYLRSPHIAHELDARPGYVSVGTLAKVALGKKTGNDNFFFLDVLGSASGGKARVRGLRRWEGVISRAHLRPALRRPQDLDDGEGRRFTVNARELPSAYLAPTAGARDAGLREYIRVGEDAGVHEGDLVASNAGARWYQQTRAVVDSPWVLPYNSAYDYLAVDNTAARAVLNGRLVGVTAVGEVDSDLLGAVLNSTLTILARLLVGVQTGNEGAYDVGPPAVRAMRVPDPRKFSPAGVAKVKEALTAIRKANRSLPAPSGKGAVDPLRRALDLAILEAMGESPGEAAILLDRIYWSYARWRRAVKVVELQVQNNRRALAERGGNRGQDPLEQAARGILDELRPDHLIDAEPLARSSAIEWIDAVTPTPDSQDALLARTTVRLRGGGTVDLHDGDRVALVAALRAVSYEGPMPIPREPHLCRAVAQSVERNRNALMAAALTRAAPRVGEAQAPAAVTRVVQMWAIEQVAMVHGKVPALTLGPVEGVDLRPQPSLLDSAGLVPPAS